MTALSFVEVREHLNFDDDVETSAYVKLLMAASLRSVENYIDRPVVEGEADESAIKAAQLLLIGHWYANREAVVVGTQKAEMPLSVAWLLTPIKVWGC